MFHATGPGRVEVDLDFSGVGVLKALLYNFDFDDFDGYKYRPLKVAHSDFLKKQVVPLLQDYSGYIWMTGAASRIGAPGWNLELSKNRVITVAAFLSGQGITADHIQTDAIGNTETATHIIDDARDRSVRIWVLPKLHFGPFVKLPPPREVPQLPKTSRHFKIAMTGALEGSLAMSRIEAHFIIWDTENNLRCTYEYGAFGLGFGLPAGVTQRGPWNSFITEKPISCAQFGPHARYTTVGALKKTENYLRIETPSGVKDVYLDPFITGTTIGGGAATYPAHVSHFRVTNGPVPYSGL